MADLAKNYGLSPSAVILAGVLVGLSCGLINGLLVAKLKLNPLVSTLATWSVIKGAAFVYSNGQPIYPLPDSFRWLAVVDIGGLQANVLYLLVLVVVAQLILSNTKFSRHVFAVGGNPGAAELTGIRHDRVVMSVYMISGLMSALAAVILAGKLSAGSPRFGDPYLLTAVAAAVLGGASLFGWSRQHSEGALRRGSGDYIDRKWHESSARPHRLAENGARWCVGCRGIHR